MKSLLQRSFLGLLGISMFLSFQQIEAQLDLPRGSQMATVSQRVGITDIKIKYSRPQVKDREIWGKLVPYGMNNLGFGTAKESPWRAGANENTIIKFTHDVMIGGQKVAAGAYGLHINVKDENSATIILSKDHGSWGSYFYNPENDVLHVDVDTKEVPHREFLTFEFTDVNPTSATASLIWEKKEIPFKIEVPVTEIVLSDVRSKLNGSTGFQRQNWERAAGFSLRNGGDLDEALKWTDAAIEGQFFSERNFNNLQLKSAILNKQGKTAEATAIMNEALPMGNQRQINALGYRLLGQKNHDMALKCFKLNVKNYPKSANAYDSLGDAYKQMGDKKSAIKNLKKALSLNPPANVKANSEKLLAELGAKV